MQVTWSLLTCKLRVTPAHYGVLVKSADLIVNGCVGLHSDSNNIISTTPNRPLYHMCHSYMHVYVAVKMPALVHLGVF